jgi:hypothetical protein
VHRLPERKKGKKRWPAFFFLSIFLGVETKKKKKKAPSGGMGKPHRKMAEKIEGDCVLIFQIIFKKKNGRLFFFGFVLDGHFCTHT